MNYTIKVDGKVYDVKILDLHSNPIKVVVDGTEIEVWPEQTSTLRESAPLSASSPTDPVAVSAPRNLRSQTTAPAEANPRAVKAPLPGVVTAIKVKVGDTVTPGQELCTIEAMKMKNIIRATRAGKIATIAVNVGETIQHHNLLMEFES